MQFLGCLGGISLPLLYLQPFSTLPSLPSRPPFPTPCQPSSASSPGGAELPILAAGPVGGLTHGGPAAFAHTVLEAHPVETVQRTHLANAREAELFVRARVYGQHAVLETRLDAALLAAPRLQPRAPGTAHRGFGPLDTMLRRDATIDVEDVFGLPELRPVSERLSAAQLCEKILRLDQ